LSPTAARQIVRLPEGNQTEVLEAIRRERLTTAELAGVVDLWFGCAAELRQQEYLLRHPREALSQAKGTLPTAHDPRLSEDGPLKLNWAQRSREYFPDSAPRRLDRNQLTRNASDSGWHSCWDFQGVVSRYRVFKGVLS